LNGNFSCDVLTSLKAYRGFSSLQYLYYYYKERQEQEVKMMNTYLKILESDINKVREQSQVCRGEWCRALESEIDALQYELMEVKKSGAGLEKARFEEMSAKLRDAYRKLAPDIHI
jgi:hypothetical protein